MSPHHMFRPFSTGLPAIGAAALLATGLMTGSAGAAAAPAAAPAAATLPAAAKLSQSAAAARLRAAGIRWFSSGGCNDRYRAACTSFDQINATTVEGVIAFQRSSGCLITITGGTETGHASGTYSHWNGYKVDINPTACVTNHIAAFQHLARRGDGAAQYRSPAGNVYARESTHWDVLYYHGAA